VNGKWSSWGEFGECSASCDGGFRKRFRTCTDPIPSQNGRPCVGPSENLEPCNDEPCPGKQWKSIVN
jgi:hemicentin